MTIHRVFLRLIFLVSAAGCSMAVSSSSPELDLMIHRKTDRMESMSPVAGELVAELLVGSCRDVVRLLVDPTSQLTWMKCTSDGYKGNYNKNDSVFDGGNSTSFVTADCLNPAMICPRDISKTFHANSFCDKAGNCAYNMSYNVGSTSGEFAKDTFTINVTDNNGRTKSVQVGHVLFGCTDKMSLLDNIVGPHIHGVLALGAGPLSFASQASVFTRGTFSYCVPVTAGLNASSGLVFGPQPGPAQTQCTELVPKVNGTFYAVNVSDILLDGADLPEVRAEKWIVDTVQSYTSLPGGTYEAIVGPLDKWMSGFGRRIKPGMFGPLEYCYSVKNELHGWPQLDFVFGDEKVFRPVGSGLVVELKPGVKCLGFMRSTNMFPVMGTIMQGDHWIQFRTGKSPKCFAKANCTR